MVRLAAQKPGELRNGLVMHPGGKTWHYCVKWRGRKRQGDTKCESRTAAERWLRLEKEKWAREEHEDAEPPAPTLRALWEEWDRLKKSSTSDSHRAGMKLCVMVHCEQFLDRSITEMTTNEVQEMREIYLSTTGKGFKRNGGHIVRAHTEGGWNRVLSQIQALLGWAVETERITNLPFKPKNLRLNVSHESKGVLWPEQVSAFLAIMDSIRKEREGDIFPHAGVAARLMIGLGLRENEALNAEWDRVDWRRGIFIVAKARTTGKKVKDRTIREIPIPPGICAYLRRWWEFCGSPLSGLVLESKKGTAHRGGGTTKAVLKGATELGIQGLTPHGLRRTFATAHWELGTPLSQISQWMGHEDPDVTLKRYIVLRSSLDQTEYQNRFDKAMRFSETVPIESQQRNNQK